ncbi:MAG: hypothetical protein R3C28_20670 [Pirellulaceae bacterium]
MGLDFVELTEAEVDLTLLQEFPQKLIYRDSLFPVSRENGSLKVATSDPFNLYSIDEAMFGHRIGRDPRSGRSS